MTIPTSIILLAAFSAVIIGAGGLSAAPWLPTRRRERDLLLKEIPIQPGQVVYDLGCGDGVVLFQLARSQPAARYVGVEVAPFPYLIGLLRKLAAGRVGRCVHLRLRDLYAVDYADADVIFVFLLDTAYPKLIKKFAGRLKPDALVIVEAWPLPGLAAERTLRHPGRLPMYAYRGHQFSAPKFKGMTA